MERLPEVWLGKHTLSLLVLAWFLASVSLAGEADGGPAISADRIKAHVAYLASDRLERRGPGPRRADEVVAGEPLDKLLQRRVGPPRTRCHKC